MSLADAVQDASRGLETFGAITGHSNQKVENLRMEVAKARLSVSVTQGRDTEAHHQGHCSKERAEAQGYLCQEMGRKTP